MGIHVSTLTPATAVSASASPDPKVVAIVTPSVTTQRAITSLAPADYRAYVIALWIAGVFLMLLRMAISLRDVDQLRRRCRPAADREILDPFTSLMESSAVQGQKIRVLLADHLSGPVAMGFLWPVITLPPRAMVLLQL